MATGKKRKRTPNDAQWCLNNIDDLSLKTFVANFSMTDRMYASTRYKNILTKYAPTDHKKRLLQELATWTKSTDAIDFWKEMKREAALRTTEATCYQVINKLLTTDSQNLLESIDTSADQGLPATTEETALISTSAAPEPDSITSAQDTLPTPPFPSANQYNTSSNEDSSNEDSSNEDSSNDGEWVFNGTNVTNLFKRYQHKIKDRVVEKNSFQAESDLQEVLALSNILFLAPNQHSELKVKVFGCQVIDSLCHATITRFMDNLEADFSTQEISDLAVIVDDIQTGKKLTIDAQVDLLVMAKTMGPTKAAVVRGIANLVVKLPTREIVDLDSLGETELQSTYFDPVLAPLLSNPQQNVVLRWANKNEEVSNIRPDAVISTIIQSKYGRPLGFGEVKPGNSSTNKHSLCMDTLRLATLSKDTIDRYSQDSCFAFQVNGFRVSFFMLPVHHENLYIMLEVATFVFPSSLDTLDALTTKKNLCTLARVSSSFWNNSTTPSKS
ncbi:hypothetical protein DFQ28_002265, partial [Apophysomyces sp. BC1034]